MNLPKKQKVLATLGVLLLLGITITFLSWEPSQSEDDWRIDRDGSKLTNEERIAVLNRMVINPDDPELTIYRSVDLFNRACSEADPHNYEALAKVFRSFNGNPRLLPAISTLYLRREVEKLKAHPPSKINLPLVKPESQFQAVPPPLQKAHLLALSISEPFRKSVKPAAPIPYHDNQKQWTELITRFFDGKDRVKADEFAAYQWDSFCGTMVESFLGPRSLMFFLSLVEEGQHSEALGAALLLRDGLDNYSNEFIQTLRSYFEAFNINPGEIALGMLVDEELQNQPSFLRPNILLQLAAEKQEEKALLLIEILRIARQDVHCDYIVTLGALLAPKDRDEVISVTSGIPTPPRENFEPASRRVQKEIFEFFDEFASFKTSPEALKALARRLGDLKRPEGGPILLKLSYHPNTEIAKEAAEAIVKLEQ